MSVTAFPTAQDNVSTVLASSYTPSVSTQISVQTGDGTLFGTPSPTAPVLVTIVKASAISQGLITDRTKVGTYLFTGRTTDTLTGMTFESGTDQTFGPGDLVFMFVTATAVNAIQAAIQAIQTSYAASVAGRTGAVTLAQADVSGLTVTSSPTFADATLGIQPAGNVLDLARANVLPFLAALGAPAYSDSGAFDSAAPASADLNYIGAGTLSGYGSPVGVQPAFNRVETDVFPNDPTHPVSVIRCRVLQTNESGTVLADCSVPLAQFLPAGYDPTLNVGNPVRVVFDLGITVNSGSPLWVEFRTDGTAGLRYSAYVYTVGGGYPAAKWAADSRVYQISALAGSLSGSNVWFRFSNSDAGATTETATNPFNTLGNYAFSNFSGFGFPVGNPQNFDRVQWDIQAWSLASVPTMLRARLRSVNGSGTVLAEKRFPVSPAPAGAAYRVTWDLDTPVANAAAGQLWLEFYTDGYISIRNLLTVAFPAGSGYPNAVYTTTVGVDAVPTWSNVSPNDGYYARFAFVGVRARRTRSMEEAGALITAAVNRLAQPAYSLPANLYAVQGQEANVYFENVTRSNLPATLVPEKFQTAVVCNRSGTDIGKTELLRWTATPVSGDVGTRTFTLKTFYNAQLLAARQCNLVIKATTTSAVTRKLLMIGDSTTAGGEALAELKRLCSGSGLTVTTVGTITGTTNDSTSSPQTWAAEAVSGTDINYWYTGVGNAHTNPFLNGGNFDFAHYLTANSITMSASDWVVIHLGINDVSVYDNAGLYPTDAAVTGKFATMLTQLKLMVTNVRAAVSGVRIGFCLTIPPDHNQDGFGVFYGNTLVQWKHSRNVALWREQLIANFDGLSASNQYVIPYHAGLDTRNNFQYSSQNANAYNTTQVTRSINSVHPASSGYYQMGNTLYCFLRGQEA
jgi:hypothetical protein